MTIIENLQREDLSALEQAQAFRVLSQEFSLTQAQIGERVGLHASPSRITCGCSSSRGSDATAGGEEDHVRRAKS
jgi:ParB-like chromosome segregation protein Spo0J